MSDYWAGKAVGVSGVVTPVRLALEAALAEAGVHLTSLSPDATAGLLHQTLARLSALDGWVHFPELMSWPLLAADGAFSHRVGRCLEEAHQTLSAVGQKMRSQQRGAVVVMTDLGGLSVRHGDVAGATASAALLQLSRALGVTWAKDGVRVNAVAMGHLDGATSGGEREIDQARTPLGRLAKDSEVAKAALFLLSDDASFITAECLPVDGGWLAYQYFYPAAHPAGGAPKGPTAGENGSGGVVDG